MGPTETPRVAVVGAGFAGSLTAAHLLRNATKPFDISLIERRPPFGAGVAFKTSLPCHLLNVPVIRMSAIPDEPEHLLRWLAGREAGSGQSFATKAAFLPRHLYGEYVEHTVRAAAEGSPARLTRIVGEAVAIEPDSRGESQRVRMRDGSSLDARSVVLAIGNPPPSDPLRSGGLRGSRRYAADPWADGALDELDPDGRVVIIGSNLTMVDVALALDHMRHRGPIVAVSRHGLLPQPHSSDLSPAWTSRVGGRTGGPRAILGAMREEVPVAAAEGVGWRSVVDSIRPKTRSIWGSWPDEERRRFLRHARPYWEVHRHRMAPENARTIDALLRAGRLEIMAGRIAGVKETGSAIEVRVARRGSQRPETLTAARVVNCTGPGMDYGASSDELVRDLLARGLALPGPLGLGFDASPDGALIGSDGRPSTALFTLGPPLKGRDWETTAVPEVREQASALAKRLTPR
ncbi:MAG TPA: FAD/NAD(P)-binding protein [Candidatus Limnocylindrales bacterium]|nr:FAD/NAD(P)-binding protein [Candidatus Limnocylindrales bacterium]